MTKKEELEHQEPQGVKTISLETPVLSENDRQAAKNRAFLKARGIRTINLISSPGSGKTTLLVETLNRLKNSLRIAVIEGDQQTSRDADRIAATGVPVVQINTQQACHLSAAQVRRSFDQLPMESIDLLIIENVGNLICPADYDLGEDEKIALMSIAEGEEKPLKYPLIFNLAHVLVLTKMDLLPHLRFDLRACIKNAHTVNPDLKIIQTSVFDGSGIDSWITFLKDGLQFDSLRRSQLVKDDDSTQ